MKKNVLLEMGANAPAAGSDRWAALSNSPLSGLAISAVAMLAIGATGALSEYSILTLAGLLMLGWLAAENGGNDVSKGVAPLVSLGLTSETGAVIYGAITTILGSGASLFLAQGVMKLFTSGLLDPKMAVTDSMVLAIAAGACLWVALATRFSLPVSTTHALVGAVVVVGSISFGLSHVLWLNLGSKVVLPLLFGPVSGLIISWLVTLVYGRLPMGQAVGRSGTWLTSGAICFVRAVNDTPKIVAIGALTLLSQTSAYGQVTVPFLLIAIAMALGSVIKGLPVTRLLARKVTTIDTAGSFSSSLTAAALILSASRFGLPVSTTHVATGAIIGSGLTKGGKAVQWGVVRDVALSWVATLPGSGLLAGVVYLLWSVVGGN